LALHLIGMTDSTPISFFRRLGNKFILFLESSRHTSYQPNRQEGSWNCRLRLECCCLFHPVPSSNTCSWCTVGCWYVQLVDDRDIAIIVLSLVLYDIWWSCKLNTSVICSSSKMTLIARSKDVFQQSSSLSLELNYNTGNKSIQCERKYIKMFPIRIVRWLLSRVNFVSKKGLMHYLELISLCLPPCMSMIAWFSMIDDWLDSFDWFIIQ